MMMGMPAEELDEVARYLSYQNMVTGNASILLSENDVMWI